MLPVRYKLRTFHMEKNAFQFFDIFHVILFLSVHTRVPMRMRINSCTYIMNARNRYCTSEYVIRIIHGIEKTRRPRDGV